MFQRMFESMGGILEEMMGITRELSGTMLRMLGMI